MLVIFLSAATVFVFFPLFFTNQLLKKGIELPVFFQRWRFDCDGTQFCIEWFLRGGLIGCLFDLRSPLSYFTPHLAICVIAPDWVPNVIAGLYEAWIRLGNIHCRRFVVQFLQCAVAQTTRKMKQLLWFFYIMFKNPFQLIQSMLCY